MGSLHPRRSGVGIVALVVALVGTGCEEADRADPSTSPSESSESASTSPSEPTTTDTAPVEPTMPPEAEAETRAGVEAFVEHYFDAVNFATATGDMALLKSLDQPSCVGCQGGIDHIERVYNAGGRFVGGEYSVLDLEPARSPSGYWSVVTHTKLGTQRVVDAGRLNRIYPGGRAKWLIGVSRVRDAWTVSYLEIL